MLSEDLTKPVFDHGDLGMSGHREVRPHLDPTCAIRVRAGRGAGRDLVAERLEQMMGCACR